MMSEEENNALDIYLSLMADKTYNEPSILCIGCFSKHKIHAKRTLNKEGWRIWAHDGYVWCKECLLEELRKK